MRSDARLFAVDRRIYRVDRWPVLSATNGHHDFEDMCRHLAHQRIAPEFDPRDADGSIVGICTLQKDSIAGKD